MKPKNITKTTHITLAAITISCLLLNLYWLGCFVAFLQTLCYFVYRSEIKPKVIGLYYVLFFTAILLFTIAVKVFLVNLYYVPSRSMENAIMPGDIVVANKLVYGPRLPRSPLEIPWINILFYLNSKGKDSINKQWWPYYRLNGYSTIKRDDLVLFNSPTNPDMVLIKRCIALPGETVQIINDSIFINKKLSVQANSVKLNKLVYCADAKALSQELDAKGILHYNSNYVDAIEIQIGLNQLKDLYQINNIDSIKPIISDTVNIFPVSKEFDWQFDNYGPLLIPKQGTEIKLNRRNFLLYSQIINFYEGNNISMKSDSVFIDGEFETHYLFKKNYFWMMGDNRNDSYDSRYFGMVPKENIISKASIILFSKPQYGDIQWHRFFKVLN